MAPKEVQGRKARKTGRQASQPSSAQLGDSWVGHEGDDRFLDEGEDCGSDDEDSIDWATHYEPEASATDPRRRMSQRFRSGNVDSVPRSSITQSELRLPMLDHNDASHRLRQRKPSAIKSARPRMPARRESHTPGVAVGVAQQTAGFLKEVLFYFFEILGTALSLLKTPISLLLVGYLLLGMLTIGGNLATASVHHALSPICRVPGVSLLGLSLCKRSAAARWGAAPPPPEFDRLMESQLKFEDILQSSTAGVGLPADMKRSEAAIRDLRTLVRYSGLKSRNELALEFDGFVETARAASADLQRFNSHVGRAADIIISTAHWTMRTLDEFEEQKVSRGAISAFVADTLLAPFQPNSRTPALVLDQYVSHTGFVEAQIARLLDEAQAVLMVLQNLEDRLDIIHDIATRDSQTAHIARDELLGQLWTLFPANNREVKSYNSQLELLQHVGEYRKTAWAHVSMTILKLQAMGAELEELRERVKAPSLLAGRVDLPLKVHLQAIQMGVERLEAGRQEMRDAQGNFYHRAMGRAGELDEPVKGKLIGS